MKDIFYNGNEALTYNKLFNFVVGNRGAGKTYWAKDWAIRDFLKKGNQFIYLRRYKEELKNPKKNFFDDISPKFPKHEFKVKGDQIFIDDKVAGCFMALSTAKIQKSTPYPKVNKIIFDEFILDKGFYHYLQDEVVNFLELYETINRLRINFETMQEENPLKVFFLSNAITVSNPYFLYFKMNIETPNKRFYQIELEGVKDILVEFVAKKEFIDLKKQTRFGRLVSGTEYGNYAIDNNFYRDNKTFIEKKTGKAHHYFSLKYYDRLYNVWLDPIEGKYFISKDKDPYTKTVFSLTQSDHSPNTFLLKGRKDRFLADFIENYKLGNVYYEDINLKNVFFEIIRLFLI